MNSILRRLLPTFPLCGLIAVGAVAAAAGQTVIVEWNFPIDTANAVADGGVPANTNRVITAEGVSGELVFSTAVSKTPATWAATVSTGWQEGAGTNAWQIELTTTAFGQLTISSKQRSSNTGPRDFEIQYRVGDGAWSALDGGGMTVANNWTTGVVTELPLPSACDDQDSIAIRWVMISTARVDGQGDVGSQGVSQIDDIIVRGQRLYLHPPQVLPATDISAAEFTANWTPVDGAQYYLLDVATDAAFSGGYDLDYTTTVVSWDFDDQTVVASGGIETNLSRAIALETPDRDITYIGGAGATGYAASSSGWADGSGSRYWIANLSTSGYGMLRLSSRQRASATGPRDFKVQYRIDEDGEWVDVAGSSLLLAGDFTTGVLDALALPLECESVDRLYLRWIMTSNIAVNEGTVGPSGTSQIDDIEVSGHAILPGENTFVSGYQARSVSDTHINVTGLVRGYYYYRVRAIGDGLSSAYSGTQTVRAADTPPGYLFIGR